jgi:hypothetical protein
MSKQPKIPASIRNRNPLAQYPGKSAKRFGSTTFELLNSKDGEHKIARFPTHEQGAAAGFHLLSTVYVGMTVEAAIKKWCGGYYVETYLDVLEKRAGVKRSQRLTKEFLRDPERAIPLAKAMSWQETGRDYPMTDEDWQEAHAMCFAPPATWEPDNALPTPKPETRIEQSVKAAGKAVLIGGVPVGGTGAAVVAKSPPDLSWATSWQGFANQVHDLGAWAFGSPLKIVIVIGAVIGVSWVIPAIVRRWA